MTDARRWVELILGKAPPADAWRAIFDKLKDLAIASSSPVELHTQTVAPDRLLAEGAWDLWHACSASAVRTSAALREWWSKPSSTGRAVLILDALSLRELPALLGGATARGIEPVHVGVTGAEVPSTTDQFARALGAPQRSSLANNHAPKGFALASDSLYSDVLGLPFEDCVGSVPAVPDVFFWHSWLDELIHLQKLPDQLARLAFDGLQSDGFWKFVNRLRQGRKLLITADHGYAVGRMFSTEESDDAVVRALRDVFGASRYASAAMAWPHTFMPPVVMTENDYHVVMGQRKWKVQGGFPHLSHGGLSLLEVAVPFVEFPAL